MPRPLSLDTVIEKNRVASGVAFLVFMQIEVMSEIDGSLLETLYFVRNNEDITYQGQLYTRSSFTFSITESSESVVDVSLDIRDPTRSVIKKLEDHDGGVGWRIKMMIVNSDALDQDPEYEELVYVMGSSVNGYVASVRLGARNPLGTRFPARGQWRDRCQWIYKSEECGYTGPMPSCDYSLQGDNGCAAHNNTLRFGGFPGIRNRSL